jgi:AcrR family transcriptional regulator
MPRKRTEIARDDKVAEILEVAQRQLRDGPDALSVAGIARELGLAQNAIYWYFPSRAHLFVEALKRMLYTIAARKPRGQEGLERILWWTDQFAQLYAFRPALQQQARDSEVVAEFVRELDQLLERMLTNGFRGRVPEADLMPAIASFRATAIGTYAERLTRARRRELLTFTLQRLWTSQPAS